MQSAKRRSLTPDSSVLRALAEATHDWKTILGELIDNAFDAGATRVAVAFGPAKDGRPEYVTVTDDGAGCEDLYAVLTLGGRVTHRSTKLGRYGVGAKDAFLWIGGVDSRVTVRSVRGKASRSLTVDWGALVRSGTWDIDDGAFSEEPSAPGDVGTSITVRPVRRRIPEGAAWKSLVDTIGYLYSPAINRGKQIVVKGPARDAVLTPVESWKLPERTEMVDKWIEVGGKRAHVVVGLVKDGVRNTRPGFTYWHEFRVIREATSEGCGGVSTERIAGVVDLHEGWVLSKNKDNISQDSEALFAAVFEACKELLTKAETLSHCLELDALRSGAEQCVNGMLFPGSPDKKAKRGEGEQAGTRLPTGKGGKHKKARDEQPGRTFGGKRFSSVSIEFSPFDGEQIGRFDAAGRVYINQDNPLVMQARKERNNLAVVLVALSVLSSADGFVERQLKLPTIGQSPSDKFCGVLGHLTARPVGMNGEPVSHGVLVPSAGGVA